MQTGDFRDAPYIISFFPRNLKSEHCNSPTEIKGLEYLTNLDELNLESNPFKEKEEKYLIDSDAPIKAIIYYCRTKKLETDEIKLLNNFDEGFHRYKSEREP